MNNEMTPELWSALIWLTVALAIISALIIIAIGVVWLRWIDRH
jgi:hypothetical protein